MSRISRLDRTQVTPEIAAGFDKAFAQRGNVPNMFRVMAHRPEIFATMQAHFAAVLNTGTVSTKLKELIIVRTSQVNDTPYCLASHTILVWDGPTINSLTWPSGRSARILPPRKKPPCAWPKPSPAMPTRSATISSPTCAASTLKVKSWNCSAPSGSLTTSTALTMPFRCNPPNPVKAAARLSPQT